MAQSAAGVVTHILQAWSSGDEAAGDEPSLPAGEEQRHAGRHIETAYLLKAPQEMAMRDSQIIKFYLLRETSRSTPCGS
jgi:hypothetical protein